MNVLATLLLLLLGSTGANDAQMKHGIVLDEMDTNGQGFVLHKGVKFAVLFDEEQKVPFFVNTKRFAMLYQDPRYAPPPVPIVAGAVLDDATEEWYVVDKEKGKFKVMKDEDGTPYYINSITKESQWEDPRESPPPCSDEDGSGTCTNPDGETKVKVETITTLSGEVWYVYYSETKDEGEKVPYYLHSKTRVTQWEDPRALLLQAPKSTPAHQRAASSLEEEEDEYE